jgi:Lon protease-like protein
MSTQYIPLFPLSIVAFPGEQVNLHIFEERYRQMIHDCTQEDYPDFAIVPFIEGKLMTMGTQVHIEEIVKRYETGEMDIRTRGQYKAHIHHFDKVAPGKLYPGGEVELEEITDYQNDPILIQKLYDYFQKLHQAIGTEKDLIQSPDNFVSFDIAHHVGLSVNQEFELLQLASEQDREEYLVNHLEEILPYVRQTKALEERVKLNGHFRSISSPDNF